MEREKTSAFMKWFQKQEGKRPSKEETWELWFKVGEARLALDRALALAEDVNKWEMKQEAALLGWCASTGKKNG